MVPSATCAAVPAMVPAGSFLRGLSPLLSALAGFMVLALGAPASWALVADEAGDVCAPAADPCLVTTEIDVVPDSILDFGTRTVSVGGSGRFDFGAGNGTILCGSLLANTSGAAINARGPGTLPGTTESGLVQIEARRACEGAARACLEESDCRLGSCNVRRCSLRAARTCSDDSACQLGSCIAPGLPNARRCSLSLTTRCTSNADCQFGTCPEQLTCSGEARVPVTCTGDADCDFGQCTVGQGAIDLDSPINGSSDVPAIVILKAADGITLRKPVNLGSGSSDSDGGELELEALGGDIRLLGSVSASGGRTATGGSLRATASNDVVMEAVIDASGGDFDGGTVEIAAGRDVLIRRSIDCNASAGAGFGGEIAAAAGRDLFVQGIGAGSPTRLSADGHTDASNFSGDGGTLELSAERDMLLGAFTRLEGSGSAPDGAGADVFLGTGRDLMIEAAIEARSKGLKGSGGFVDVATGGSLGVGAGATIDLTGGEGGGGSISMLIGEDALFAGSADVAAGGGGGGGSVLLDSGAMTMLAGTLTTGGDASGELALSGCEVVLTASARMDSHPAGGDNILVARQSMRLEAGSQVLAAGQNVLTTRSALTPPLVEGVVQPPPMLVVDSNLAPCTVCNDDSDCDDGVECTIDACIDGACQSSPDHAQCAAEDPCMAGTCNAAGGCELAPVDDGEPCDDGDQCTSGDACQEGSCLGAPSCEPSCGNGKTESGEDCDDGDTAFVAGDHCAADCRRVPCGKPTGSGGVRPNASDALFTLRSALGLAACDMRVCNVDGNSAINASDSLRILRAAVGQSVAMNCPA